MDFAFAVVAVVAFLLAVAIAWSLNTRRPGSLASEPPSRPLPPQRRARRPGPPLALGLGVLLLAGCSAVAGHSITVAYDHPDFGRVDVTYQFPEGETAPVQSISLPGGPSVTLATSQ